MFKNFSASLLAAAAFSAATPAFAQAIPAQTSRDSTYRLPPAEQLRRGATRADAMKWEAGYLILSAIDTVQTVRCIERDPDCVELNPFWGKKPKSEHIIIGKIIGGALHFYAIDRISRRNPRLALRLAQVSVVVQGGVVGFNLTSDF